MHAGLGLIDLIHAENGFIEVGNFMAIADLFLGVKIDGAVVDAKFVALEEWHSHLLLIKNHNLLQQVSTLNLTRMLLDPPIQQSNPIHLPLLSHESLY